MSNLILIISIFCFLIGFYVIKSDFSKKLNRYFGLGAFMIGIWVLLNYFFSMTGSPAILKAIYAHAPFLIIATTLWISLLKTEKFTKLIIVYALSSLPINLFFAFQMFCNPTAITGVESYTKYTTGPMFNIYTGYVVVLFLILISYMVFQYFHSDKDTKKKFLLIILGLILIIVIASIVGFILPALGNSQFNILDSASSIFFVLAGAYSIIRNKFLDIKTVATEIISYMLLILIFFILFVNQGQTIPIIIKIGIYALTIYGAFILVKSIKHEISQKEKIETLAAELKDANAHLKELDQAKDDFLSMASHELNTPISAIEGYLSMILDEGLGGVIPPKAKTYLDSVYMSSKRLANLVKDLLNVSRIESGRIHLINVEAQITDIIDQAVMEIAPKVKEANHTLTFHKPTSPVPKTWFDVTRITEIMINMLGNSCKYTPPGGKIDIRVWHDDSKIVVGVIDNGKGIPKESKDKVFQKFTQVDVLKDEVKGTGLGMYIAQRLIKLHNGQIWFESEGSGKGTAFYFSLPVLKAKPVDPHEGEGPVLH